MLTDTAIRALKPGPRPIKKSDGGGLFILVTPEGTKHWRLAYRFLGKQKLLCGGPYGCSRSRSARILLAQFEEPIQKPLAGFLKT